MIRRWAAWCPPAFLCVAGALLALWVTQPGVGVSPDSVAYASAARSLLAGHGLRAPFLPGALGAMAGYGPMFPLLLCVPGLFGVDPYVAARWLNSLLFGANILLAAIVIHRLTRGSRWAPTLGALLMLGSSAMLSVHTMAWSEPTFLLFGFLGLLLLGEYLERPGRAMLLGAAAAIGLAFLARYAGAALVGTGAVALLFTGGRPLLRRVQDAFVFGAIASLPMGVWAVRNALVAGTSTNRHLAVHPITADYVRVHWLPAVGVALALCMLWLWKAGREKGRMPNAEFGTGGEAESGTPSSAFDPRPSALAPVPLRALGLMAFFPLAYGLFLVVTISFVEAMPHLGDRILSPFYAAALMVIVSVTYHAGRHAPRAKPILTMVLASMASLSLWHAARWAVSHHSDAQGYASRSHRQSEIIQHVRALPPGTLIYSNYADALTFLTEGRYSSLPAKVDPGSKLPNPGFAKEMADMAGTLREEGGFLVYLRGHWNPRWYAPSEDEIQLLLPLRLIVAASDGAIYALAPL